MTAPSSQSLTWGYNNVWVLSDESRLIKKCVGRFRFLKNRITFKICIFNNNQIRKSSSSKIQIRHFRTEY